MARILVVDDDITTQLLLQDLLESEGHEVLVASHGVEGFAQATQHRPNLMVCDWMMPQLDGLELCRRVKQNPQLEATFLILLTARENLSDRVCGLDAGADDFISKPLETEELLARVRAGLRLNHYHQQLSQSLQELQTTQSQLIQSEKMSSLGRLVGGIAHEINNPISFIYGNLAHVEDYTQTLSDLVRSLRDDESFSREQFLERLDELDFDFAVEDLESLLCSMKHGSERIREIVTSLQEFSSKDRQGIHDIDLHHALELSLSMLQPRYTDDNGLRSLDIERQYGELPSVKGHISPINQALFNLLENAIDALLARSQQANSAATSWTPKLAIATRAIDERWVELIISDNGIGIDDQINSKMFDPFFTTKPVGQGKGLGLSVSYQIIVQQHEGQLTYRTSEPDLTHFIVRLPVSSACFERPETPQSQPSSLSSLSSSSETCLG